MTVTVQGTGSIAVSPTVGAPGSLERATTRFYGDGEMFAERVLQELFRAGFDALKADPSLVDDLLYKLDSSARADIKAWLTGHTVTVRTNFPVGDDIKYPLITIVNGLDQEDPSMDFLDDYYGVTSYTLGEDTEIGSTFGHGEQTELRVFCIAGKDANAVLYLYYLAKALLIINREQLQAHGLHVPTISGRDIELRQDLFPGVNFAKQITFTCRRYFAVRVTEKVAKTLVIEIFMTNLETGITEQVNVEEP